MLHWAWRISKRRGMRMFLAGALVALLAHNAQNFGWVMTELWIGGIVPSNLTVPYHRFAIRLADIGMSIGCVLMVAGLIRGSGIRQPTCRRMG